MAMSRAVRQRTVDVAFAIVLGTIALAGLDETYDSPRYLVVGVIGLGIGAIVALLTDSLRVSHAVAIGILTYLFTVGPVVFPETMAAAIIPTGQTITAIGEGTVNGWWGILTTEPPLPTVSGPLLVPPFLSGLAAGLASVLMARVRFALAPLVPIVGLVVVVILFGTTRSQAPTLHASVFVALTLLWGTLRYRRRIGSSRTDASLIRRVVTPAALLLAAALAVVAYDTVVAPVDDDDRYVLRDHVLPPFDPSVYPSPLSGFRSYEKRLKDEVLFTVTGLPPGARLRLATMDSYDGIVWNVVNGDGGPADGSGVFHRMGSRIETDLTGQRATLTVTIGAYRDIWMPTAGGVRSVTFAGDRAAELSDSFRYNTRTRIGVLPVGLREGDSYTLEVVIPRDPSPQDLDGRSFGLVTLPPLVNVPDEIEAVAVEWLGGRGGEVSTADLRLIVDTLKLGAFSDGDEQSGVASPPGHGAGRLRAFLSGAQLVGDDEQYAATLALMARELGLPARVVLGAIPPAEDFDGKVTGDMVSAWVEVNIDGLGWVPLDPTPPVTNEPDQRTIRNDKEYDGQVLEPPVVQAQPPRPVPPPQGAEPLADVECLLWFCFDDLPEWAQWVIRYVVPPVLGVGLILLTIVVLKARRARRRRTRGAPVTRVSGAWQELVDRLRDHGVPTTPFDTRHDVAQRVGGEATARLAVLADAAVFGPGEPDDAFARTVWDLLPAAIREVTAGRSRWQRFLARINPVSLRPDARARAMRQRRRRGGPLPTPATAPS